MIWKTLIWQSISFGDWKKNKIKIKAKWIKADILKKLKMSWKCSVPAQLWCRGMGKKARLRLLQVWAKAAGRPGLIFFLPYYHWRHISRTRNSQKIIRSQPSTVKIKEKNISSILNLLIIKTVCIIPSYYLNRRIEAELEECGDVAVLVFVAYDWFKQSQRAIA